MLFVSLLLSFIAGSLCVEIRASSNPPSLSSYNIKDVTVSGLSSGGFMAVQVHIAFSSIVNGSAIFAGGPFYCAENNLIYAEDKCMATYMGTPNVAELVAITNKDALAKFIDSPINLSDDRVYIFSGKDDTVVDQAVVQSLQQYYQYYVPVDNIVADYNIPAEHCFPTLNYGESCSQLKSPYIGKCDFDGAYTALSTLYGSNLKSGTALSSNLMEFDQTPYFKSATSSIGKVGYIYVPTACAKGTACSLHLSFHGCEQNLDAIGNQYAADTGFNSWAEANNIIMVYPYVVASEFNPSNPNGCWDWWGYTDYTYGVQEGVQMQFVKNVIDAIRK